MKIIIAGDRDITNFKRVRAIINRCPFPITEVVCGEARGVDTLGKQWATEQGIPVKSFPADWDTHGKAAGPIRNQQMADYADALCAIWMPSKSRGTKDMIQRAFKAGLHMFIVNWEAPPS